MNKEIDIFKGVANLPTYTDKDTGAVDVGTASNALPRISLKGGIFTRIEGATKKEIGKEFVGVVIGSSGTKDSDGISNDSHRYYASAYTGEDGISPDCASINGVTPDSTLETPECATCKDCKRQIWGSKKGRTGGKARECGDYRRLAIGIFKDEASIEIDVYQLDIPATSLSGLKGYSSSLKKDHHMPLDAVVTKIKIESPTGYPVLIFEPFKALGENQYNVIRKLRDEEVVKIITTREVTNYDAETDKAETPKTEKEVKAEPVKVNNSDEIQAKINKALNGE